MANIKIRWTVQFGSRKGQRVEAWFSWSDNVLHKILNDPRYEAEIIDRA